jgi:flagellar biosynthesis component FlhA
MYIAGAALAFLGIFGGLPWYMFVPFGLVIIFLGTRVEGKKALQSIA